MDEFILHNQIKLKIPFLESIQLYLLKSLNINTNSINIRQMTNAESIIHIHLVLAVTTTLTGNCKTNYQQTISPLGIVYKERNMKSFDIHENHIYQYNHKHFY